jgi:predicted RNase H-like nuclease
LARYIGIDGCPAGWFAAWRANDGSVDGQIYPTLAALFKEHTDSQRVLIDIPIGLMQDQERLLESEVRQRLGARRSSVFPVPCYAATYATDYPSANQLNRERTGKGLSKQAWYLTPKIREVNDYLIDHLEARTVLGESHPELAFAHFNGSPMQHAKKREEGASERLAVLSNLLPNPHLFLEAQLQRYKRKEMVLDDCLDALVLLATASRAVRLNVAEPQMGYADIEVSMWVPEV